MNIFGQACGYAWYQVEQLQHVLFLQKSLFKLLQSFSSCAAVSFPVWHKLLTTQVFCWDVVCLKLCSFKLILALSFTKVDLYVLKLIQNANSFTVLLHFSIPCQEGACQWIPELQSVILSLGQKKIYLFRNIKIFSGFKCQLNWYWCYQFHQVALVQIWQEVITSSHRMPPGSKRSASLCSRSYNYIQ